MQNSFCTNVNVVLADIGAKTILQLQVMNKIDLLDRFLPRIDYDAKNKPKRVWISSANNVGMDLLKQAIVELLTKRMVRCRVSLQPDQGKLRAKLYTLGVVKSEANDDEGRWLLDLEIQQLDFERLFR